MNVLRHAWIVLALVSLMTTAAAAQDGSSTEKEKAPENPLRIHGLVFGDVYYLMDAIDEEDKDKNGLTFRRIYFGADYKISDEFSSRFRLEANDNTLQGSNKIGVIVKDAWLRWKGVFDGSDLYVGMSPTPAFGVSEKAWGYRWLERTIMDNYGIVSSRDLGVDLKGKVDGSGMVRYWVKVGNNSGNSPEQDKYKRYYASVQVQPAEGFQFTVYGDYASKPEVADSAGMGQDNSAYVLAGFLNYARGDAFSIGVEGFYKNQANNYYDMDANALAAQSGFGISAWAHVTLVDGVRLVGRYDSYDPNTASGRTNDTRSLLLAAVDVQVGPTVNFAPGVLVQGLEGAENSDVAPRISFNWTF